MKLAQTTTVGLFAAALLVGTTVAGCGGDEKETTSSSSSSSSATSATSTTTSAPASPAAQGADYSNLLLKPADVDPSFTASDPVRNPNGQPGIGQTLTNAAKGEVLLFAIFVDESPAGAVQALQGFKTSLAKEVTGEPQPADVGDGGFIATGTNPDGSKAVTEVYFTQGKALVNLEFESAPNDPVPPESALAIAKMQDAQIKNNLPA
ncbi:hypothetical protein ACNO8X_25225 [Mycobacterium sp. PDNC021]|uniref:hypothetical protein n=1 Tax=Mycobacterium sp. PDNC021 TaxID=3391399 RepID=UPI003AB00956